MDKENQIIWIAMAFIGALLILAFYTNLKAQEESIEQKQAIYEMNNTIQKFINYTNENVCLPVNLTNKIVSCYVGNKSSCYNQKTNGTDIVLWSGE